MPDAPFVLIYSSSQCVDYWKLIGQISIEECAQKCHAEEGCFYFGYGMKQHFKQCYNAGYNCKIRTKGAIIDFDIYQILASGISSNSLMKLRNLCNMQKGTPYCARDDPNICKNTNNGAYFAESVQSCALYCRDRYGSGVIAFSNYDHYKNQGSPNGQDRCLCYEDTQPENCVGFLHEDECKIGNPTRKSNCWWDLYFVLENPQDKITSFSCPGENVFISSSRPALSRLKVDTMSDCCFSCKERKDCAFSVMEWETKYCYLLPAPSSTITKRIGWISCTRSGCSGMKKAEADFHPEEMWWDEREYI